MNPALSPDRDRDPDADRDRDRDRDPDAYRDPDADRDPDRDPDRDRDRDRDRDADRDPDPDPVAPPRPPAAHANFHPMSDDENDGSAFGEVQAPTALGFVTVALPMAGGAACIAVLARGMAAVMAVGGQCADNAMYAGAVPCPKGTGLFMPLSIFVGLGLVGLYVVRANAEKAPNFALLFWPALFWTLGWNFFAYGGWALGVMFAVMGGAPVVSLLATSFPGLGAFGQRAVLGPLRNLGRKVVEPSREWATKESSAEGAAVATAAGQPLFRGDAAAFRVWLAGQAGAAVLGFAGGRAFVAWLSR
ncbi:MAG TPA: hypothetical protein VMB50_06630 [Myxococcales bacterium]|nr:hypothetical protein [Myxococcales bacterium]